MNNLFISYDLNNPGQGYEKVADAIKSLGNWARVHKSFWYVKSNSTASQAAEIVWKVMDQNDTLIVVDATHNDACWYNVSDEVSEFIQNKWRQNSFAYQRVF